MQSWMMVLSLVALPVLLSAQDFPNPEFRDTAIIPYFQSANPEIVYFQTFTAKSWTSNTPSCWFVAALPDRGGIPLAFPCALFGGPKETCWGCF